MTDYDDALLDDDILSLPDVSDEEYDSNYINNNCQAKTKDVSSNHFLGLGGFDAFENVVANKNENDIEFITKKSNISKGDFYTKEEKENENTCDDEYKLICHKNDNNSQFQVESTSMYVTNNNEWPETDLRTKLKNNIQNIIENTIRNKRNDNKLPNINLGIDNTQNDNNFESHDCNRLETNSYQVCQNFKQTDGQFTPYSINSVPEATFLPLEHNQYYTSLHYQPHHSNSNQNMLSNYEMQYPPLQQSLCLLNPHLPRNNVLPSNQPLPVNSIFPLQKNLSMNQVLPFNQDLSANHYLQSPVMSVGAMTSNQNEQMMRNSNIIMPHHLQPFHSCRSIYDNNHYAYVINSLRINNNLNVHKILINRNFKQNMTKGEVRVINNTAKDNSSKIRYLHNNTQEIQNDDPYLYFSNVWREKIIQNKTNQTFFSPEVVFSNVTEKPNSKKYNKKQNKKQKDNATQKNSARKNRRIRIRRRQLEKLRKRSDEKFENNNNHNQRKQGSTVINKLVEISKNEEHMNAEMKDYCKQVEEQKKRREMFLEQKEKRRKIFAMEKLGITKKSFTYPTEKSRDKTHTKEH